MSKVIDKLTPEQEALIPVVREEWIKIGLCTDPADREMAEKGVDLAYKAANLEPPARKIWAQSPFDGAKIVALLENPELKGDELKKAISARLNDCCWGQHDAGWLSFYDFFKRIGVEGLDQLEGLWMIAKSAGWWWPFEELAVITERPVELHLDDRNRLHSTTGMALRYPDGWGFYVVHGVRVPEKIIKREYGVAEIDAEANAEVRRIMIDLYNGGDSGRYLREAGANVIHEDKDLLGLPRRLLKRDVRDDEPIVVVEVTNSTPEPVSAADIAYLAMNANLPLDVLYQQKPEIFKKYYIRVRPQMATCADAVASTFPTGDLKYQFVRET